MKYSLRYSKTGMIHGNYMKLEEFNYTGFDSVTMLSEDCKWWRPACGLSGQYNSFKLIQNESPALGS